MPAFPRRLPHPLIRGCAGMLVLSLAGCAQGDDPHGSAPVPAAAPSTPADHAAGDPQTQEGVAMPAESPKAQGRAASALPPNFKPYATQPVGDGQACVAGAATDADGLKQRAVVALQKGPARTVAWARNLEGLETLYQSRATHCVQGDGVLFVLLQSDTDPSPSISQTLLHVAKLDMQGDVLGVSAVSLPDVQGQAYSAYVDDVPADFSWQEGSLVVKGTYFLMSDPDERKPFTVEVDPDAKS